uniref:coxsackievirus and adenovirus receptor homolog isoform X2 n=1 Tax=Doryrhamphus excisus TaxID=161450 RepID=UPI0025AE2E9A|nr:coxsackievirus and adenovirus receptor homolog isoform X2 [Doryrhamphus excisus]
MVWVLRYLVMMLSFCSPGYGNLVINRGKTATFLCRYTLSSADGYYDIKWLKQLPSMKEPVYRSIVTFTNGNLYTDLYQPMKGRVSFEFPDPSKGDASIAIKGLQTSDTGTYVCKVRKSAEILKDKAFVIEVTEKSVVTCTVHGEPTLGMDVMFKCSSLESIKVRYTWKKTSGNKMLPPDAIEDTEKGELFINIRDDDDYGHYLCTVEGLASSKSCLVQLKDPLDPPPSDDDESPGTAFPVTPNNDPAVPSNDPMASSNDPMASSNGDTTTIAAVTTTMLLLAIVCAMVGIWYWRKRIGSYAPNERGEVAQPRPDGATVLPQPSNGGHLYYDQVDDL